MRKLNYIAPLWSIFIIYSNMLFSQKPAQSTDLEIVNSKPYKTEKNGSATIRRKDKVLSSQVGQNIKEPGENKLKKTKNN